MAWTRLPFSLALVFLVTFSCGAELEEPPMQTPPLLNYGVKLAGDNEITSFDSSHRIDLPFNISYFGSSYNQIYISSDGLISFVPEVRFLEGVTWSEGIRNPVADRPFLAPYYHEGFNPVRVGHATYQGKLLYRVIEAEKLQKEGATDDKHYSEKKELLKYFDDYVPEAVINAPKDFSAKLVVVVTWLDVTDTTSARKSTCDETLVNPCDAATFQAVIIADKENTFVMFNYLKMEIKYQTSYQSGFNGGYGRGWFNVIPCHGHCAINLNASRVNDLPNLKGSDRKGRYFLKVGGEEIVRGGCLPNSLRAGMLEMYPTEVGMFGGEKLEVSGKCLQATSEIFCKFGTTDDSPITKGAMSNDMKGYCPVPLLTTRGPVMVSWSNDGKDWAAEKIITVVLPDHSDMPVENEQNMKDWASRDATSITINWDKNKMTTNEGAMVEIKLLGYRETSSKVEYKVLKTFEKVQNSAGVFSFQTNDYACTENCKDFEMGLLEVGLVKNYYGDASDRVALRLGPIPIGWYVNKQLTEDMDSDWSDQMCRSWSKEEKMNRDWLSKLPKCPCTLDQALADVGRWQADPSCDLYRGSTCYYHKKAKHCVRSVKATSDGAGNQCCYDNDHELMWSQLSYQGSTPDRAHAWGKEPYNAPDRVPSLSHWKRDVIPFYYCCLWNNYDLCELYTHQRPTTDCANYDVPGLALVRGDPHFTTFDGQHFNFGGKGDYWLLKTDEVQIQGRFEARRGSWDLGKLRKTDSTSWKPTALTSVAISGSGTIVEIQPAPANAIRQRGLDIRVDKRRHFFYTKKNRWQHFRGQSIINNAITIENNPHNNFTILTGGVGIIVYSVNNLLHVTVAVPPSMKTSKNNPVGMGLLGSFDGENGNDFTSASNTVISPGTSTKDLYNKYGKSWSVMLEDSLFLFYNNPNQYKDYIPYYEYTEIPHDFDKAPTAAMISNACGDDDNCKWDYRITGSRKVALATLEEDKLFAYTQPSAKRIQSCGLPAVGEMAEMDSYNFFVGRTVTVEGCGADFTFEGEAKFECIQERPEQAKDHDRDDYGRRFTENDDEFLIHWVPKPYTVCEANPSSANLGMIIGIAAGAVVLIIIIIVVIVLIKKKRGSYSSGSDKPRPSDRVRRERGQDADTEEPMMSRERNAVYKPAGRQASSSAV